MAQTLKFLGRGSAFNVEEGNTSAFIKENNTLFLIDCGSNIFERIINKNLLDGVKNVYVAITHRHPDHVGSLGDLIFYCYYILGVKVKILNTDFMISKYLLLNGVSGDLYDWFEKNVNELSITIHKTKANHTKMFINKTGQIDSLKNYLPLSNTFEDIFPCFGFILEYKYKTIFYSGDCCEYDFGDISRYNSEIYVDCCFANYKNNIHYNIEQLNKDIQLSGYFDKQNVYCMHFDCDEAIVKAKELGFSVVELYE